MKPPPPRLPAAGYVTASAKAVATAASTALPPCLRMDTPTSDAGPETDTTTPLWHSTDWLGYSPEGVRGLVSVRPPGPAHPSISRKRDVNELSNGIRRCAFMSKTNSVARLVAGKVAFAKTSYGPCRRRLRFQSKSLMTFFLSRSRSRLPGKRSPPLPHTESGLSIPNPRQSAGSGQALPRRPWWIPRRKCGHADRSQRPSRQPRRHEPLQAAIPRARPRRG
jgi:hypothetical protein